MARNPHDHLNGESPRARNESNLATVSGFVYRVGYSTPALLQSLIEVQTTGWFSAAIKRGDFQKVKTGVGKPPFVITLTDSTLRLAEYHASRLSAYPEIDFARINQSLIRHNLFVQEVTLRAMAGGSIAEFLTEREISEGDERGSKRPDAVWILKTGIRMAIEVELTAKWSRHLDDFVFGVVAALERTNGQSKYDRFLVVTDSQAILNRYSESFATGQPLNTWKKDARGQWTIVKKERVPAWASERVSFRLVEVS
jgi:hypothetical protein